MTISILVAGDFRYSMYEAEFCAGLRSAGCRVEEFKLTDYLSFDHLSGRAQVKAGLGPAITAANLGLVKRVLRTRPRVVLGWRTHWLYPLTVRAVQRIGGAKFVLYNNDDPFGPDQRLLIWRRFRSLIPHAAACFAYRDVNIAEYRQAGASKVGLLRSWYNPQLHRPLELGPADKQRYECDVVFVGHCERDERLDLMDGLLGTDLKVRIWGTDWAAFAEGRRWRHQLPIAPVRGEEYVKAIAGAKVALVFLSKRNRDEYTRRCFEIPAIGTLMLAPRTRELLSLYESGKEAVFYSGAAELIASARRYAAAGEERRVIAAAGRQRCVSSGYDFASCARAFIEDLRRLGVC